MVPEEMFEKLLGLDISWKILSVSYIESSKTVAIVVSETDWLWSNWSCCEDDGRFSCYEHCDEIVWRHLNIFEYRCEIRCRVPRGKCSKCKKVVRAPIPWEGKSKHFTFGFEAFALTLARQMPINQVALTLGENDKRIWRVLNAYVQEAYKEESFGVVRIVGCDEMNVRKGHNYISVFADLQEKRVLFATAGKDSSTWDRFKEELPKHGGDPAEIESVSIDMSPAYQAGARNTCPGARLVFDKFHVMKLVGEAVNEVRNREIRSGCAAAKKALKNTRYLWLKNPENLTQEQALHFERIDQSNLITAKAYQMRLTLQDIYRIEDEMFAHKKLIAWCRWVKLYARKHDWIFRKMKTVSETIMKHLDGVLAHFKDRVTHAFMEGLNSVFSAVKRKARGFRNTNNLISVLYFVAGKLNLPANPFH